MSSVDALSLNRLRSRAVRLEYLTVAWMILEAGIGLVAGIRASSIALLGFGLDSVIEVAAATTVLWRVQQHRIEDAQAERRAAQIVGFTFFALAAYVTYESIAALWLRRLPESSLVGMVLAGIALVGMPLLGIAKRRVATALNSRALAAESMQSLCCAYFAATLLGGLLLNSWLGWWWADPLAALLMVALMIREGLAAIKNPQASCSCCEVQNEFVPARSEKDDRAI